MIVERLRTEEFALPERSRPDPAPSPVDLPTSVAAVLLQVQVPALVPAPPVIDPPQPELPVATPAPAVVSPEPPSVDLPTPVVVVPLQAKVPALVSTSPGIDSPQPEPPVATPAPAVVSPEPQCPRLQRVGLGPRAARPTLGASPAGSVPPPAPRPGPAALPLTAEQQARLAAMPAASRDQVLLWLATGDPILVAEARAKLAPLSPRPEAPKTLPELLGRIRQDASYPALAASGLAAALQDQKSYSGYLRRCEEAWRGELNPDQLLSAYEQAMGPKARNRGAIFMVAVRQKE